MSKKSKPVEHYFSSVPKCDDRFGLVRAKLRGRSFEFLTSSSVFSKKKVDLGTHVLIDAMVLPEKGSVLDIGCGYGAVGIAAAASNPNLRVVMTDVNMRAVRLARQNVVNNRIRNAEVRYGYLYEPVADMRFDCVLSNPPVSAGMDTVKGVIAGAAGVLAAGGSFQMVIRSKIGAKALPEAFVAVFGNCEVLARESGFRVLMGRVGV
ncbi:MAG: methyltransferase [Candidatus Bathyarchaeota archaeon]|nr:methyltransferase [Candidatus Bathyarchaeota archaeon]